MPQIKVLSPPDRRVSSVPPAHWRRRATSVAVGSAMLLGGLAAYAELRRRMTERHHPIHRPIITVGNLRMEVLDAGRGRPVVWLHGVGGMVEDFAGSVMPDVIRRYRAVAINRPGYGHSDNMADVDGTPEEQATLMLAAIERLGLRQPVVVGHSFGALVAAAMALQAPEALSGLLLINGYLYPTPTPGATLLSLPAMPFLGPMLSHTLWPLGMQLIGQAAMRHIFTPDPVPEAFMDSFPFELTTRPSQIHATSSDLRVMERGASRLSPRYPDLAVPVVILAGSRDEITEPRAHSQRLARERAGTVLHMVEAGHMLHHSQPDAVMQALDECWRAADSVAEPRWRRVF